MTPPHLPGLLSPHAIQGLPWDRSVGPMMTLINVVFVLDATVPPQVLMQQSHGRIRLLTMLCYGVPDGRPTTL